MCSAVAQVTDLRQKHTVAITFAMQKVKFIIDPSPEQSVTDDDKLTSSLCISQHH